MSFFFYGSHVVVDQRLEVHVVAPLLVHAHCFFRPRRLRVDKHRQLVEFDFDLFAEIFSLGPGRRDAHRDRLAHEAHLAVRQRMPLRELVARHGRRCDHRRHIGEIVADENLAFGAARLDDAPDAAMRDGTAEKGDLALPG